jgi:hypothetical protein
VHSDVDPPLEQSLFKLLDEHAPRPDLAEGKRAIAIARGRDRDERELDTGHPQRLHGALGLGEREPTAATADAEKHRPIASERAGRSRRRAAELE